MVALGRVSLGLLIVATLVAAPHTPAFADPGASITGTVREDGTGRPLSDVCVTAHDENTRARASSEGSGLDGGYAITGLPQGAYQITFRDCRAIPLYRAEVHRDRPLDLWSPNVEVVWVPAGGTVVVDASLELGGAIVAELRWAHTGLPAAVCLAARSADSSEYVIGEPRWVSCPGAGAPPGSAVLGGLVAGAHLLDLVAPDWSTHYGWYGGATHATATRVHVAPGESRELEVIVEPRPSLPAAAWEAPSASLRFDDVDDASLHASAIATLAHLGVMVGAGQHRFDPSRPATRGQMASALVRVLGLWGARPEPAGDAFDDDDGSLHEPALDALAAAGIFQGTGRRTAAPDTPLSRAQAAALVTRAYEYRTTWALKPGPDRFTDVDGNRLEAEIARAASAGLMQGTATGTFAPGSSLTRAQAATTLARLLALVESDLLGGAS